MRYAVAAGRVVGCVAVVGQSNAVVPSDAPRVEASKKDFAYRVRNQVNLPERSRSVRVSRSAARVGRVPRI